MVGRVELLWSSLQSQSPTYSKRKERKKGTNGCIVVCLYSWSCEVAQSGRQRCVVTRFAAHPPRPPTTASDCRPVIRCPPASHSTSNCPTGVTTSPASFTSDRSLGVSVNVTSRDAPAGSAFTLVKSNNDFYYIFAPYVSRSLY